MPPASPLRVRSRMRRSRPARRSSPNPARSACCAQQAGLLDHFSVLCGGDEVSLGKPSPDLYLLALRRLGAVASTSIAFEDSGHGVQAALAAGLATIAVPDLKAPAPEWLARCHAVLPSLDAACERSPEWFGVICAQ
jgi:beta-phosphoglucomutase-like phosphatase (HAD superfamily)